MARKLTVDECLDRAEEHAKALRKKRLSKKRKKYHQHQRTSFLRRAAIRKAETMRKVTFIKRRKKGQGLVKGQGFLPNFLNQMNVVRIEELVADRVFNEIKKQIESGFPGKGPALEFNIDHKKLEKVIRKLQNRKAKAS